ncbi:hypothetical protein [Halorhabdus salina]|uniref:hypothetical protein n=1 Tax=Halorhabdus salina TaxID=2750670 RepID=UPI0015EFC913|nr:hypothetical protein [Halorhabdus salina]
MNPVTRLLPSHTEISEQQAESLSQDLHDSYPVQVLPPGDRSCPETLNETIKGLLELQSDWLGLRNASPTTAYEITRTTTNKLKLRFVLPTKRLERKLRTHLKNEVPDVEFREGRTSLPVQDGDELGGGLLTTGRADWYPLRTDFDQPPANSIAAALHRHAMQDTRFLIQVLFQPVHGNPVKRWYWRRRAYQRRNYLRKEKESFWGTISPTKREKRQADAVEQKAGTTRFHTSIRLLIIGAGEYTPSRVKELAGAFNTFENPETGQYLDAVTLNTLFPSRIYRFASAVHQRDFNGYHRRFQTSIPELSALVSVPDRNQANIETSQL